MQSFGTMAETPPNINEFNQIAALVFAQLYRAFPVEVDIDGEAIAKALGVEGNWGNHMLPSGRSFYDMLSGTIGWLMADNYIRFQPLSKREAHNKRAAGHECSSIPVEGDCRYGVAESHREKFWGF